MWYRSTKTNKIIYSSAFRIVDNVFGEGTFFDLIQNGTLTPISNPTVIDVLRDGGSTVLATIRYRQIHGCDIREAREGVKLLSLCLPRRIRTSRLQPSKPLGIRASLL